MCGTVRQVEFLKLLYDKMLGLHLHNAATVNEWRFPRPSFKVSQLRVLGSRVSDLQTSDCGWAVLVCISVFNINRKCGHVHSAALRCNLLHATVTIQTAALMCFKAARAKAYSQM